MKRFFSLLFFFFHIDPLFLFTFLFFFLFSMFVHIPTGYIAQDHRYSDVTSYITVQYANCSLVELYNQSLECKNTEQKLPTLTLFAVVRHITYSITYFLWSNWWIYYTCSEIYYLKQFNVCLLTSDPNKCLYFCLL